MSLQAVAVPPGSLLGAYARTQAFTDAYAVTVPGEVSLPRLIEAFYTTRLFKLERWVLGTLMSFPSSDEGARALAQAQAQRFAAWRVEQRSDHEILLDAGQTRSWLCVAPAPEGVGATTLFFGSAVVPLRPGGQFGWAFHALVGLHRGYSKALLAAAARRVQTLVRQR